jgi:hypothetical protein
MQSRPTFLLGAALALATASLLSPIATPARAEDPTPFPMGPHLIDGLETVPATVTLRDFADIAAGEPRVELDPSGTAATLSVSTTIPAACSVVFGTDETFGAIATDMDMAGGAHTDHHPLLSPLQPGTTYLYRLQGTAADGTLYVSRVMSFRTPDAPPSGEDLARGATIADVSSEFGAGWEATRAIDGDLGTEWSSRGDGDDAFIVLDLGAPQAIGLVGWDTRSMADGTAITETFTLTADGVEIGTFPAGPVLSAVDLTAQVLRFDVASSTGGNTGAREIVVRGPTE